MINILITPIGLLLAIVNTLFIKRLLISLVLIVSTFLITKQAYCKEIDINKEYVKCIAEEIKHSEIRQARLLSGYTCIVEYDLRLNPNHKFEIKEHIRPLRDGYK
jgi:hypothetical protein